MGVKDGDFVDVIGEDGYTGTLPAHVTEFIDPEAVFMIHGFGRQIPKQTRTYNKGVSDQRLMAGLLDKMDKAGGGLNLCESFVSVRRSEKPPEE